MTIDAALSNADVPYFDDRVAPRPGNFSPVGVVIHHTASNLTRPDAKILSGVQAGVWQTINGVTKFLEGPLCNILINRAAETRLVTLGRANDTGDGNKYVLDRILDNKPVSGTATERGDYSGNPWFIDIEIANTGTGEPYSASVMAASVKTAAALCRYNGWNPLNRVLGHKEWTNRKPDPSFDMHDFRHAVVIGVNALIVQEGGGAPHLP